MVYAMYTFYTRVSTNGVAVRYHVARLEGDRGTPTDDSLRLEGRDLRVLESRGLAIERSDWRLRSEINAYGGISMADAAAAVLACGRR